MSENIKNGEMNVMGVNVNISQILGDKIVDQYLAQLKEEDMQTLMSYITSDLFTEVGYYKAEDSKLIVKERRKDQWGNYRDKEIPIGELIKNHFNNRIKEELKKKVEEIIASTDYQERIESIANELVEYSINGYKEDMKDRIRERLVGNVLDTEPRYYGISLYDIINKVINERIGR